MCIKSDSNFFVLRNWIISLTYPHLTSSSIFPRREKMLNIRGDHFCLPASFMTVDEKEFAF